MSGTMTKRRRTNTSSQSPHIELNTYGIPKKGDYYPDEKQRAFLKCPLDLDGDETNIL